MYKFKNILAVICMTIIVLALSTRAYAEETIVTDATKWTGLRPTRPKTPPRAISANLLLNELYTQSNRVVTPQLDLPSLLQEDSLAEGFGPPRIGVTQEFPAVMKEQGLWTELPDGGWIWTVAFAAPGAKGIKLRIVPWKLPVGTELIIYNSEDYSESVGPFTSTYPSPMNYFMTLTVFSNEVYLEYYVPPEIDDPASIAIPNLNGLVNLYRDPFADETWQKRHHCHLNMTCYPDWQFEADGVGALSFRDGNGDFVVCSGGMLNRFSEDGTPLFQTAQHCGCTDDNIGSFEIIWFYQAGTCIDPVPPPDIGNFHDRTLARAVLVNHSSTDYTLLGLDLDVHPHVTFLGWTTADWGFGSSAYGIHHPHGSFKRYSYGSKTGEIAADCNDPAGCDDCYRIRYPEDHGLLEGGSSGSPVFDGSHRVRGVASCAELPPECDEKNWAWYGRFKTAFGALRPYLMPVDPVYVDGSHTGSENGTITYPFNRVIEGFFAVIAGHDLYIEAGSYDEPITFDKPMVLNALNGRVIIGE